MKVSPELLALTNKFLQDFFELCAQESDRKKRDDSFHFNYTLADAIAQSDYPRYEEETTALMGMSSFDDSIAKEMFNNRIQGFVKSIEGRLARTGEQEDYIVDKIKTEDYLKDDFEIELYTNEAGERTFKSIPCKTEAQKVTFNVSNNRNSFKGNVVLYKEKGKEFVNENEFTEKMITKEVVFFCKGERIMNVEYHFDFDNYTYFEKGTFTHYKHIADINSFFLILALC